MEQSLLSSEKSNPGIFKSVSAGSVFDTLWGLFKPDPNNTYLMIVGPHGQQEQFQAWKKNKNFKILFESKQAINTNYATYDYKKIIGKDKRGDIYATTYTPRNTVVVFEYVPEEKSSS